MGLPLIFMFGEMGREARASHSSKRLASLLLSHGWGSTRCGGNCECFFAKTRGGVDEFVNMKASLPDCKLWVSGGVDLVGVDLHRYEITQFNVLFDLLKKDEFEAAVGAIEDHYAGCIVWVEA